MPVARAGSRHVTLSGPSLCLVAAFAFCCAGYIATPTPSAAAVPGAFSVPVVPSSQHTRTPSFAVGYSLVVDSRAHRYELSPLVQALLLRKYGVKRPVLAGPPAGFHGHPNLSPCPSILSGCRRPLRWNLWNAKN